LKLFELPQVARGDLHIGRAGFHQTSKNGICDALITQNAMTLESGFYPEFEDELLLRTAKELNFNERQAEETAEQEDGKKESKKGREEERTRGSHEASEKISQAGKRKLSANIIDNVRDKFIQTKVLQRLNSLSLSVNEVRC
jgi:hypothetical protein